MAAFTGSARNSLRGMMYEFNNYKKVHIDGNTAQPLYHIFFTITPLAWLYESYHHRQVEKHMKVIREQRLVECEQSVNNTQQQLDAAKFAVDNATALLAEVERKRDEAKVNMPRYEREAQDAKSALDKLKKEMASAH